MAKIKVVILGIGIALILAFVIGFGVETFYKAPDIDNFCDNSRNPKLIQTEEECTAKNGEWEKFDNPENIGLKPNELVCTKLSEKDDEISLVCHNKEQIDGPDGFCNLYSKCQEEYTKANEPYSRNAFIIIIILGLAAVIAGAYLNLQSVSAGIMGGGVLVMLYAAMRFWRNLDEYLRFIILVITLGVLIWIGYKKFKK